MISYNGWSSQLIFEPTQPREQRRSRIINLLFPEYATRADDDTEFTDFWRRITGKTERVISITPKQLNSNCFLIC
ncbi:MULTISPECIES: hypothetical protein [unclassified Nostoc]|uniref:hypothetical protein n=1 Tax=unclassified Nostoc TaxID=2593658 RepID=UPI0013D607AC|nr:MULTISPECIES: hypothetical protein [unclassified Nostoc]MBE8997935.1 hypothetical protein [Nostoc sp. LEGE 12447]NEU82056.1 hypothetical protein [Nostoc sp. UIC 10630]